MFFRCSQHQDRIDRELALSEPIPMPILTLLLHHQTMKMQSIPGKFLHKPRMKKAQLNLLTEAAFRTPNQGSCCPGSPSNTKAHMLQTSSDDDIDRQVQSFRGRSASPQPIPSNSGEPYEDTETSGRDAGSGMPSTFGPWKQASCDAQAIVVGQQHPHPVMASTLLHLFGTTSASELIYPEASFGLRAVCCSHVS